MGELERGRVLPLRRRWRRLRHCWTMPRDALLPFAEGGREGEGGHQNEGENERTLRTNERTRTSSEEGSFSRPSPPLPSLPPSLLCRNCKQQFTSFIRRHERMKNGGSLSSLLSSRHHPLPSLALPPARLPCMTPSACVDTCCARSVPADADGALIGSQV